MPKVPRPQRAASKFERGFTLIEAMVVVALIGIMAALAGPAFIYGTRKARANNAVFEASALTTAAQMRAASSDVPQYVIWYARSDGAGVILLERADPAPAWSSVDVSSDTSLRAGLGGTIIEHTRFDVGVEYIPLAPVPVAAMTGGFPEPFTSVPINAAGSGKLLNACTFCASASGGSLGVIRYAPNGTMTFATAVAAAGGAIAIGNQAGNNSGRSVKVLAISAPSGMVRIFQ